MRKALETVLPVLPPTTPKVHEEETESERMSPDLPLQSQDDVTDSKQEPTSPKICPLCLSNASATLFIGQQWLIQDGVKNWCPERMAGVVKEAADVCQEPASGHQWYFLTDHKHEAEWHHSAYTNGCSFTAHVDSPLSHFNKIVDSLLNSELQGAVTIGRSAKIVQVWTVNQSGSQREAMRESLYNLTGAEFRRDRESDTSRFHNQRTDETKFREMTRGNVSNYGEKYLSSPERRLLLEGLLKEIQDNMEWEAAEKAYAAVNNDPCKIDLHEQRESVIPRLLNEWIPKAQRAAAAKGFAGRQIEILIITGRGNGSQFKDSPPIRNATERYLEMNYRHQYKPKRHGGAIMLTLNRFTSRM